MAIPSVENNGMVGSAQYSLPWRSGIAYLFFDVEHLYQQVRCRHMLQLCLSDSCYHSDLQCHLPRRAYDPYGWQIKAVRMIIEGLIMTK